MISNRLKAVRKITCIQNMNARGIKNKKMRGVFDMVEDIKIENVVASTDIKKTISLDKLLTVLESSEYEPEQFPGLVYRLAEPKVAFLLFASGRAVCAGANTLDAVKEAVKRLKKKLTELKAW